jgi:hypothetical protein
MFCEATTFKFPKPQKGTRHEYGSQLRQPKGSVPLPIFTGPFHTAKRGRAFQL